MLDTVFDNGEMLHAQEAALLGGSDLSADLLLASAYDGTRCRELVHADVRATLTTPWLRTLADFLA